MKQFSLKKIPLPLSLLAVFMVGAMVGPSLQSWNEAVCKRQYRLIDAKTECGPPPTIDKREYSALQNKLVRYIASEKSLGHINDVALYFRDLENGPTLGINQNMDFAPASLLKLPVALVFLSQAQDDPLLLDKPLSIKEPLWTFEEYFPPEKKIDPHEPHSIEKLLMASLQYSDNDANALLQLYLKNTGQEGAVVRIFQELGLIPEENPEDDTITVLTYARILRGLYHSIYLEPNMSERVLTWLSHSTFAQGMVGGLPSSLTVAHKFGERFAESGEKELHDCGIVYFPGNPYLLCVMTKGDDFDELASVIQSLSKQVYEEVDSRRL
jgi:beta-lactamase class A